MSSLESRRDGVAVRAIPARKSTVREYAEALAVALLLALVIRTFVLQAFKIPSGSMLPTLQIGDHILVNKFLYGPRLEVPFTDVSLGKLPGLRQPRPGDVIVFLAPAAASADGQRRDYIKRVIATSGQTVEVRNRQVYIDGQPWDDSHASFRSGRPNGAAPVTPGIRPCGSLGAGTGVSCAPYTVPPGNVFVMGDNRDQSYDSRFWGPVALDDVKGKALIIYWSWDGSDGRWVR